MLGKHRWLLHVAFWVGWVMVSDTFFSEFAVGSVRGWVEFAVNILLHVGMFYLMAYGIAPAIFRDREKIWWRLLLYPVLAVLGLMGVVVAIGLWAGGLKFNFGWRLPFRFYIANIKAILMPFFPDMAMGLLFYGVRWGVVQFIALREVKMFSNGLFHSLTVTRQSELMMRVLPHLLLNVLPNLERIIVVDYARFPKAFDKAYGIFRFFAGLPPGVRVPAWEEVQQVYQLIKIKAMALGREIPIQWEFDDGLSDLMILPMSIFGLVENVLKYAVLGKADAQAVVRVLVRDGMVFIQTENALREGAEREGNGLGMGLKNLQEQLANLLDGDFALEAGTRGDRFFVTLTYPVAVAA